MGVFLFPKALISCYNCMHRKFTDNFRTVFYAPRQQEAENAAPFPGDFLFQVT